MLCDVMMRSITDGNTWLKELKLTLSVNQSHRFRFRVAFGLGCSCVLTDSIFAMVSATPFENGSECDVVDVVCDVVRVVASYTLHSPALALVNKVDTLPVWMLDMDTTGVHWY